MAVIYGTTEPDTTNGTLGNDTIYGWASGDNVSSLSGNDTLYGNAGNDKLYGGTDNDNLDGGLGTNTLTGGTGNDTYSTNSTGDTIIEDLNEGIDTLESATSYTLRDNLEYLKLVGTSDINGTGNSLDNVLIGNDVDNILTGRGGDDTLKGAAGDDTYIIDGIGDIITEARDAGKDRVDSTVSYTLSDNLENLRLIGNGDLNGKGNALDNMLVGNAGGNSIEAGAGNDTLDGGLGKDIHSGGTGNDRYKVSSTLDAIVEYVSEGNDTVESAATSYTLSDNLEYLILVGTDASNGTGNSLDNVIVGNSADNTLQGRGGDDTLKGGAGNDTYIIDSTSAFVTETTDAGIDTVESALSYTLSSNLEYLRLVGSKDIDGAGNSLDNVILGNSADNILQGRGGDDTIRGGAGDDTYIIDGTTDIVMETTDAGTDTVESTISYTLSSNLEHLKLIGSSDIDGTGNALNNMLVGSAGSNSVDAGAGNDTLDGGLGRDTLSGGTGNDRYKVNSATDIVNEELNEGNDTVESAASSYTLSNNLEYLMLVGTDASNGTGNSLDNVIVGNGADNTLQGRDGDDTLKGGAGNDTYIIDSTSDLVTETTNAGADSVESALSYTLTSNLEYLRLVGSKDIDGTGNSLDNFILGNSADNILDGRGGDDTLKGGAGDDTYIIDISSDMITETTDAGRDLVESTVSYTVSDNIENLRLVGFSDINGTGNSLDNVLTGNGGDNVFDGQGGDDTFRGGLGDDTYIIETTSDIITETTNSGIDTVESTVSYTLISNLEYLELVGSKDINGTGNSLDNLILGNGADNTLEGRGGYDTLKGGAGNDTFIIDSTLDTIIEELNEGIDTIESALSYTLRDNLEYLTLVGSADIDGTGNSLDNVLIGNDVDNILDGRGGDDILKGGAGNDTYMLDSTSDMITEAIDAGIDAVESTVSYTLSDNIENLMLRSSSQINGKGNALDNLLVGNAGNNSMEAGGGNDTLDGGLGKDILSGGTGNDRYRVNSTEDASIEYANQGIDTVESLISYTLSDNLEYLTLVGSSDIDGTGNALDNGILGNEGNNSLDGGAGDDYIDGSDGNDTLQGSDGNDTLQGSFGNELLNGGSGNDSLDGSHDRDTLNGSGSNDTLQGGFGNDLLDGGSGDDSLDGSHDDDTLNGSDGNDVLKGSSGNDLLNGGYGVDTLTGGRNADTFYFNKLVPQQIDQIVDFAYDELEGDKIQVQAAAFSIGQDEYDRFTFNSSTGALLFDQTQFVSLQLGSAFDISKDLIIV